MVNQKAAIQHCLEVTSRKMDYNIIFQNCQKFAKEIIIHLIGDMKLSQKIPVNAEGATILSTIAAAMGSVAGSVSLAAVKLK